MRATLAPKGRSSAKHGFLVRGTHVLSTADVLWMAYPRTESTEPSAVASERNAALAELFLRACALGAPCDDLAVALANAVVDAAGVRLALEVLDGGEHRLARATELAGRVLDSVRADDKGKGSAHG